MIDLKQTRIKVDEILHTHRTNKSKLKDEQSALKQLRTQLTNIEEAQKIMQAVAQSLQQQAHEQIAKVVTQCLQTVFTDEDYGFKIRFDKKRGKTEAKLMLINKGNEVQDPLEEDSGGVLDVASFALRLAALMLAKPHHRKILIMDEPFKNISFEYRDNIRIMLESLSKDFGVQIIMVTHETGFRCGKVVRL